MIEKMEEFITELPVVDASSGATRNATLAQRLEDAANEADRVWRDRYPDDGGRGLNAALMEQAAMLIEADTDALQELADALVAERTRSRALAGIVAKVRAVTPIAFVTGDPQEHLDCLHVILNDAARTISEAVTG